MKLYKRFIALALAGGVTFLACSKADLPTQAQALMEDAEAEVTTANAVGTEKGDSPLTTGDANITITVGEVGALAKTLKSAAINLDTLYVSLMANEEKTIYNGYVLKGSGQSTVNTMLKGLASKKTWTLKAHTVDSKGKTIHHGATTFVVQPGQTVDVSLDLDAKYSMLSVHFFPIRDSVSKCELFVNNVVLAKTSFRKQSRIGDTVTLSYDYISTNANAKIKVVASGKIDGVMHALYTADTSLLVMPGVSKNHFLTLNWVGPTPKPPKGQAKMSVSLGSVGEINAYCHLKENDVLKATYLAGGIFWNDTTLTKAQSPYILTGDLNIPSGSKLTIEPGVKIYFQDSTMILVKGGAILAKGSKADPIVFELAPSAKKCDFLKFEGTDLSASKLENVKMSGARESIRLGDESEHRQAPTKNSKTLKITDCAFANTKITTDGYSTTAKLVIRGGTMDFVTVKGNYPRTEKIHLISVWIDNSTIFSDSYNGGVHMDSCFVDACQFKVGCCGARVALENCAVKRSNFKTTNSYGHVEINKSIISNCIIDIPRANFKADGSCFENKVSSGPVKLGASIMVRCSFVGNETGTGIVFSNTRGQVSMDRCDVTGFDTGIEFENVGSAARIRDCNLDGNEFYAVRNLSARDINTEKCHWGTSEESEIAARIYDYHDKIDYGKVTYTSFEGAKINTAGTP